MNLGSSVSGFTVSGFRVRVHVWGFYVFRLLGLQMVRLQLF